jgi:hypothetical protein
MTMQSNESIQWEAKPHLTTHASKQMNFRGISERKITQVIRYGRLVFSKGAEIYVMGQKEIQACARMDIDAKELHGIHVVCSTDNGVVITAYRNTSLRKLKPNRRGRRDKPQFKAA